MRYFIPGASATSMMCYLFVNPLLGHMVPSANPRYGLLQSFKIQDLDSTLLRSSWAPCLFFGGGL